jgi:hypothetical protein
MLTDDELLGFHGRSVLTAEHAEAQRLLEEHGDVFRAQLVAAHWLEAGRKQRQASNEEIAWPRRTSSDHEAGFEQATREIIAHLRRGDFLPGSDGYPDVRGF